MKLGSGAKVPAPSTGRHDGNAALASGARDTVQPTSTPAMGPEMQGSSPRLPTTTSPRAGARRTPDGTARSSGSDPAPGHVAPALGIPTYCPDCEGVCGSPTVSTAVGGACGCEGCPRCAEFHHAALRKWLGLEAERLGDKLRARGLITGDQM